MCSRRYFLVLAPLRGVALIRGRQKPVHTSVAALQSMRGEVRPIGTAERRTRIDKAQQLMRAHKMDAILLAGGTSLAYSRRCAGTPNSSPLSFPPKAIKLVSATPLTAACRMESAHELE